MNVKNKGLEILIKILIVLSCPMLTIALSNRYEIQYAIVGAVFSLFVIAVIINKVKIKEIDKKILAITFFISCYMMKTFMTFFVGRKTLITLAKMLHVHQNYIKYLLGVLALPALMFFVYAFIKIFIPKIKYFFANLSKVEKRYFNIMLWGSILLSIVIAHTTTAFSSPRNENKNIYYDVIYTSDTGTLVSRNAFLNFGHEENDYRQCLFALCSLPFAVPAQIISEILIFVPENITYGTTLTVMQFVLTTISTILISRMMKLEEKDKKYLYILFGVSFPYLIFNLIIEQYVVALFYLILAIYAYEHCDGPNFAYVGAAGTLITSGVMVGCIAKFKNIKQYIKDVFKCFSTFIAAFIITGQVPRLWETEQRLTFYCRYMNYERMSDNIVQFLNIVKAIFFSAPGYIYNEKYKMCKPEGICVVGIIILCIMLISFILNRKERMAKVSFFWVLFSVFVLAIIGWGAVENGLMLYTLYFAWAYLSLYFMFLKKLFKNRNVFRCAILSSVLIMAFLNIRELINIFIFAIQHY